MLQFCDDARNLDVIRAVFVQIMLVQIFIALASVLIVVQSAGLYGWDTHQIKKSSTIDCLQKNNTAQFIILTAMDPNGVVDPDVCNELKWAEDSNIPHRDVKFIPCPTCSASAESQFATMLNNLNTNCAPSSWSGRVWMDVNTNNYWFPQDSTGYAANQKWFQQMIDACVNTKGVTCGVYSAHDEYKWIFGSISYTYAAATALPLWYSPDGSKTVTPDNFEDFQPFGGYTVPYAKQYFYAYETCGVPYLYEDWAPVW